MAPGAIEGYVKKKRSVCVLGRGGEMGKCGCWDERSWQLPSARGEMCHRDACLAKGGEVLQGEGGERRRDEVKQGSIRNDGGSDGMEGLGGEGKRGGGRERGGMQ